MRIPVGMYILSVCLAAGSLMAQEPAKTPPPPAAKQTKKAPVVVAIPKDAVETTPGLYSWKDKNGKVWMYRRSPFGVMRWAADSTATTESAEDKRNQATTAVEEGDSIRFAQATPFGTRTWVRKKTELNEAEQRIWDLQQKNRTAGPTAEKE